MCNLSQGIEEKGIAIGEAGLIMKMYKNGFTAEQIASATDKDIEEVKAIICREGTCACIVLLWWQKNSFL